jgi:hypothetical protein
MSMAQQKNELRNLFKESVKPGNFNEGRDVQKLRISRIMFGSEWWNIFNNESSGGSNDTFGRYLAQCTLCATILSMVKFLKRKIMLVQPADDIDRPLFLFSSYFVFDRIE